MAGRGDLRSITSGTSYWTSCYLWKAVVTLRRAPSPTFFASLSTVSQVASMSAISQVSNTPSQSLFFPCLRLMSESTGALRSLRKCFHASRPQTCQCCSRRILCGLGSIIYRIQTDTCIRLLNKLRVLSLHQLCQCMLTDNSCRRRTYFLSCKRTHHSGSLSFYN